MNCDFTSYANGWTDNANFRVVPESTQGLG